MKSSSQESPLKAQPKSQPHTILLAVTGMSPAVLTETVWALAHETPAVIPNEIIVLTTSVGEKAIQEQLFGPDQVWQNLRNALLKPKSAPSRRDNRLVFGPNPSHVKVFHQVAENGQPTPLSTIDSLEQNTP
jgi:CRISPR-associated protein (TIGR02584 family)